MDPFTKLAQIWPVRVPQVVEYKVGLMRAWYIAYVAVFFYYFILLLASPSWISSETKVNLQLVKDFRQ
jgi:hypothetical protein